MTDDIKKLEGRAYAKGYAAGRARVRRDIDRELRRARDRQDFLTLYAATLQGTIVNAAWNTGDKRWSSIGDYAVGAANIADRALQELNTRHPV